MHHVQNWLNQIASVTTTGGQNIEVWTLNHTQDPAVLSPWARHFREHYCPDNIIDALRNGTGLSRKEYLEQIVFPDRRNAPGPSIRAGDFAELLIADYLEYHLNYWVPRARMEAKAVRNESVKGCDVIGFRILRDGVKSPNDELVIYESKAKLTAGGDENRLQTAVTDSAKDSLRKAEALNFLKRRMIERQDQNSNRVQRFQNPAEDPYVEINGAAAILSSDVFNSQNLQTTDISQHPNSANLRLLVIHGQELMPFVHALYDRCGDEA